MSKIHIVKKIISILKSAPGQVYYLNAPLTLFSYIAGVIVQYVGCLHCTHSSWVGSLNSHIVL